MDAQPVQGANPPDGVHPNAPAPAPAGGDWRAQLQPEARSGIVNTILETLSRHSPVSEPEGLNKLRRIAVRFEEKIYTAATSQSDYLRKVSLKMLSMETRTQQAPGNAQGVQKRLAVLNKRTKGCCSCMSPLLSVVAIAILVVIVWHLVKYL